MTHTPNPDDSATLVDEINDYCERAKVSPSTLCVRALGNSRFLDRLSRKMEKLEQDKVALRAYMAANPPRSDAEPQAGAA